MVSGAKRSPEPGPAGGTGPGSHLERVKAPVLMAATVVTLTVALRWRDPHQAGSWGVCPVKVITGFDCPGCGSLRAINDLTHLDLVSAASSNLLLVAAVPLSVLAWAWWLKLSLQGRSWSPGAGWRIFLYAVAAVALVFTVIRNLPGSWLAA